MNEGKRLEAILERAKIIKTKWLEYRATIGSDEPDYLSQAFCFAGYKTLPETFQRGLPKDLREAFQEHEEIADAEGAASIAAAAAAAAAASARPTAMAARAAVGASSASASRPRTAATGGQTRRESMGDESESLGASVSRPSSRNTDNPFSGEKSRRGNIADEAPTASASTAPRHFPHSRSVGSAEDEVIAVDADEGDDESPDHAGAGHRGRGQRRQARSRSRSRSLPPTDDTGFDSNNDEGFTYISKEAQRKRIISARNKTYYRNAQAKRAVQADIAARVAAAAEPASEAESGSFKDDGDV
jgi:hypothetical protein